MATLTGKIIADFTTSLAAAMAIGATSATLQSATDDDGVALPSGRYFFTLDGSNSSKEHISCSLSGTALTSIKSVSRQGVETSGTVRAHRLGSTVTITDFAHILQINNLVNGTTNLDASDPLEYDGTATISTANQLATKAYVDGVAISGSPDSSTTVKGIGRVSVTPVSAATPIFVGDNDPRVPTQAENDALQGTVGSPSNTNRYITGDDVVEADTASRIPRRRSTGDITVPTTPTNSTDAASKSYVDGGFTFVAGEAFTGATTPQPAKLVSDLIQPFSDAFLDVGTSSVTRYAMRIIPRSNCSIGSAVLPYFWSSDGTVTQTVTIQTDSSNNPSGTVITNGTSDSRALNQNTTQSIRYQNYTFSTPCALTAGTTYWVVVTLSGTTTQAVRIPSLATAYCSFLGRTFNGSWASSNVPAIELIATTGESYSLWRSDGDGAFQLKAFDYFVTSTASAGAVVNALKDGQISGFTSLDTNADYYLSNTIGTITKNRNEGCFIGTASSTTTLIVPKNRVKTTFKIADAWQTISDGGANNASVPMVFLEDGVLTFEYKPPTFGGNTLGGNVYMATSYANNTSPKTVANSRFSSGTTGGVIIGAYQVSFQVNKGNRFMFGDTNGSSGGITGSNVFFTPI